MVLQGWYLLIRAVAQETVSEVAIEERPEHFLLSNSTSCRGLPSSVLCHGGHGRGLARRHVQASASTPGRQTACAEGKPMLPASAVLLSPTPHGDVALLCVHTQRQGNFSCRSCIASCRCKAAMAVRWYGCSWVCLPSSGTGHGAGVLSFARFPGDSSSS